MGPLVVWRTAARNHIEFVVSLMNPQPADFDARVDTAVALFCEGHAETYIAAAIGVYPYQVRKWLRAAAKARAEEREEAIERHRLQLRYLWQRFVAQFAYRDEKTGEVKQRQMKPNDVQTLLKLQEREARLLGLDAPAKAEFTHEFASASVDELRREAERLGIDTAALAALPSGEVIDAEFELERSEATPFPTPTPSDSI